jgi:hypothetical protein
MSEALSPPDDLLTRGEAATLAGSSPRTIARWEEEGLLPSYPGPTPTGGGRRQRLYRRAHVLEAIQRKRGAASGHEGTRPDTDGVDDVTSRHDTRGHDTSREDTSGSGAPWPTSARERIADLEDDVRALSIQLDTMREDREVYAGTFTRQLRQLTDQSVQQNQQSYALEVRSSAEVHVAQREAGLLAEQVDDLRRGHEVLVDAQQASAAQYEARIAELKASHAREHAALQASHDAQRAALQESLARAQAEVDRLVATGARRDQQLAGLTAELGAYQRWAGRSMFARALGRPELPSSAATPPLLSDREEEG